MDAEAFAAYVLSNAPRFDTTHPHRHGSLYGLVRGLPKEQESDMSPTISARQTRVHF